MALPNYLPQLQYNPILDTDSYKGGHFQLMRRGTTHVYSYIESRGGKYPATIFAGAQQLFYHKLNQPMQDWHMEEAREFWPKHGLAYNAAMWDKIKHKYDGLPPLRVRTVPEGMLVPVSHPLMTIDNLDEDCAALTSYKETMFVRDIWPCVTIATRIFYMKQKLKHQVFDLYSDNPVSPFAILDFASRGVFGYDHSCLGGLAHLMHFMGSDNVPAIRHVNYYYDSPMSAFSVFATEHSISCSYGEGNDDDYIRETLERVPEGCIVSLVGDTWDIFRFTRRLVTFKELIINKRLQIVCRPDSGVFRKVLPEVFSIMADGFGTQLNSKGLGVLNLGAKVLQGDGIDEDTFLEPFFIARDAGIAPDSVMTGSGGGLMTKGITRDTNSIAMKSSEQTINGEILGIRKKPATDPGKTSKIGQFSLTRDADGFHILDGRTYKGVDDLLQERYNLSGVVNPTTLDAMRALVDSQL